ncbi:MAG: HlyD family efflux transporter periplasmic adaptor subunit [Piscirickettsiaceae bacterium]|nr:HlyD family efflux transporter periplasmic adaptor subunit [Piscirickettsiaceae bacterium]
MQKRLFLAVVILLIAVAIFMGLKASKPEKISLQTPEKVWRVDTVIVNFQDVSPTVTVYGRVETPRLASLNAALVADVTAVNVLEGTDVELGQVLLTLDNADVLLLIEQRRADLAEIKALIASEYNRFQRDQGLLDNEKSLLQLAENSVVRAKKLEQKRLTSQSFLDDALAVKQRQLVSLKRLQHDINEHPSRLANLKAKQSRFNALLAQATLNLERTIITAPFTGRIAQLNVAIGERVNVGKKLFSIYDFSDLEVRAQLPNRIIKQTRTELEKGQQLTAKAILDEQAVNFELVRLSGEVRADSGGVDGLFRLTDRQQSLVLGSFVELSLSLAKQSSLIEIPFSALYGLNKVYRINEGYLEAVHIERIGEVIKDNNVVLLVRSDALQQGDHIISTQLPNAMTGLRVEMVH